MKPPVESCFAAVLALAGPVMAQVPCAMPHLIGMAHPANATSTRLYDVAAFAPNDVWAVGQRWAAVAGQTNSYAWIQHWDGTRFTEVPCPSPGVPNLRTWCELRAVGGSGPDDVWAAGFYERQFPNNGHVGPQILLLHWDGSAWTQVPEPLPQFTYMASASGTRIDDIVAVAANDVWFYGWWPGDQFTPGGPLTAHWDGSSVSVFDIGPLPNSNNAWQLADVDHLPGGEAWGVAAARGGPNYATWVGRRTGGSWALQTIPKLPITYYDLFTVGAIASNDVWVAGSERVLNPAGPTVPYTIHWDGAAWTRFPTHGFVREFVALASNDVWAFGTAIEHWNGFVWTLVADFADTLSSAQSWGAIAAGPCDIWTVGTQWVGSGGPPVIALAAHLRPATEGRSELRLPCATTAYPQSLLLLTPPRLGQVLRAVADDPLGTVGLAGTLPVTWVFALGPGPAAPCGTLFPGLGLGGGSVEVLLDSTMTSGGLATWAPGQPAEFAVSLPNQPALAGLFLASQAAFLMPNGVFATSALDLVLGQ